MQSCEPGVTAFTFLYNCSPQPPAHYSKKGNKGGDTQERRQPEVAMGKSKSGDSVPKDAFLKHIVCVDVGDGIDM